MKAVATARSKPKSEYQTAGKSINEDHIVICARILGYLLLNAPSQSALREVANVVHSCRKDDSRYDNFLELGDCFLNWFIRPCKSQRVVTEELRSDHHQSGNTKEKPLCCQTTLAASHTMETEGQCWLTSRRHLQIT